MKKLFLSFLTLVTLSASAQTNCSGLPSSFSSYNEAVSKVQRFGFSFIDRVNTSKSSWIRGAAFYSCDNKYGFIIIKTDNESYIHQNVPVSVWYRFKSASSFGSFYSANIRGRYQLGLSR